MIWLIVYLIIGLIWACSAFCMMRFLRKDVYRPLYQYIMWFILDLIVWPIPMACWIFRDR